MNNFSKMLVLAVLLLVGCHLSAQTHQYVDLGLPSGTLWATCNVGANKPEDYGNYYAWGETQTKTTYYWSTYKFNGNSNGLTKYCNNSYFGNNGYTDNLTTLQRVDDPAASWGTGWSSPSKVQWNELLENTTSKWATQNGVKGRRFTSKKNGNTLFLPAAGYCDTDTREYVGITGNYWSGSLGTRTPNEACRLGFGLEGIEMYEDYRAFGLSVRPVRSSR